MAVTYKYLGHFPKPLLKDLVAGRWLPFIGAGFSRNAVVPANKKMPLWSDLGTEMSEDLVDYNPNGPLDIISAYEHEYGRPKLIERLTDLLMIAEARPAAAHRAFCAIPFDLVITTNFDFLLEKQYELLLKQCTPLIDEAQLSIKLHDAGVALLKLHGDLHHPHRLIATESDYDLFLDKFPLIATYLASLLIARTAVFIGYSLDDPDFRQVWQVVRERLGSSRHLAYALIVSARPTDISRFERRGVKVINLPAGRLSYNEVLSGVFEELKDYLDTHVIPASIVKEEKPAQELSLPRDSQTRICLFAIPLILQSFYRDEIFPVVNSVGLVPMTADDVVSPGDNWLLKVDAIIERAFLFVVDLSSTNTIIELGAALQKFSRSHILILLNVESTLPANLRDVTHIRRPDPGSAEMDEFLQKLEAWFAEKARQNLTVFLEEPQRLLRSGETRAAVISAITLLEMTLRQALNLRVPNISRVVTLNHLMNEARRQQLIELRNASNVDRWIKIRNEIVHKGVGVSRNQASEIVSGVHELIQEISGRSNSLRL